MSLRSWNPTMVAQGVLWVLFGLLLRPEPGTGGSEGRDLGLGLDSAKVYCALSVSSPVQGEAGDPRRPQSQGISSLQMLPAPKGQDSGAGGRTWSQKSKNQESFLEEGT